MKKQSIRELQDQLAEFENKWKRALADYQNLEKRTKNERALYARLAAVPLMAKMLPLLDDLERANGHLKDKGLEMVIKQFKTVLKEEGLTEIDPNGQMFDPNRMECVEKNDGEENKVLAVVLKGYMMGDAVIRPAKVIVGIKNK